MFARRVRRYPGDQVRKKVTRASRNSDADSKRSARVRAIARRTIATRGSGTCGATSSSGGGFARRTA
ncbi:MAG: hypothetical protein R3A48_16200 [Polyangiales bacterium]